MARVIRQSRWVFLRWVLFLLIIGGVVLLCLFTNELDAIIHKRTHESFQEKFISANVYVASTHLVEDEGIELSQFVLLSNKQAQCSSSSAIFPPVLEAENVLLDCPSRIEELALAKEIPIKSVTFDTATIHTYRRPDGTWSLDALKTNPNAPANPNLPTPVLYFKNTTIVLHDMMDSKTERKLILRNVEMTIDSAEKTLRNAHGLPVSDENGQPKELTFCPFQGTAESEFTRNITFYGKFYPSEGEILVEVDITGMNYSDDLRNSIPIEIADRLKELQHIRGLINVHAKVAADLSNFNAASYHLEGQMTDGRSADPRFPKLVSSLSTDFQISNEGFLFPNLKVRYGNGLLDLNVAQKGYGPNAIKKIVSKIRNIELSDAFFASLPEGIQKLEQELSPTGRFDMNAEFFFDGQYWTTTGRILCSDISLTHADFPYRIEDLKGEIQLNGSQVQYHFQTENQQIQIQGNFTSSSKQNPQPPAGTVTIQALRVPVDERIISACPEETANFIRSLEPGGSINARANYNFSCDAQNPRSHLTLKIDLLKNSCQYQGFPYPLRNVEGSIQIDGQHISAPNICGTNGNAKVNLSLNAFMSKPLIQPVGLKAAEKEERSANSETESSNDSAIEYEIQIKGTNVTLDEELYANLPARAAEVFKYIQPYGTVNIRFEHRTPNISAFLAAAAPAPIAPAYGSAVLPNTFLPNSASFSSTVPHQNPAHFSAEASSTPSEKKAPNLSPSNLVLWVDTVGDGIRISLPGMRYWLDNFKGAFQYQNGQILLTNFSAVHGATRFSGSATGNVHSVNQWTLCLNQFTIDNLKLNHELLSMLPQDVRVQIASKRPSGTFYFNGSVDFTCGNRTKNPFSLDWLGEIGIVDGSLDVGMRLQSMNGGLKVTGHWDPNSFICGGELNLNSLFARSIQFTQVHGPIWIDGRQILLGGDADRFLQARAVQNLTEEEKKKLNLEFLPGNASRSMNAKFIGGDLFGTFALQFGYPSTFQSHIVLTNGKLEDCTSLTGNDQLKGKMYGSMTLTGTDSSLHSLKGTGEFHLADADIYKLSVMMSLLKILSLKEVTDTGFSSSDMQFRIDGNHIYFDQINFYGDAFSLFGKGEMDFKSQVKLLFYSVMGRNDKKIPIISPLLHATGRQMLLITLNGPVQNPKITQQPLPGLNMALQQMEEDLPQPPALSPSGNLRPNR